MADWESTYGKKFDEFVASIVDTRPNYIVPVAKKGCKIFRRFRIPSDSETCPVRYREFFSFSSVDLRGKRVAIFDNTTRHGAGLREYRDWFEEARASVQTYAFVGHRDIRSGGDELYDPSVRCALSLSEGAYQEYLASEQRYLVGNGLHKDLDHTTVTARVSPSDLDVLMNQLRELGYLYEVGENSESFRRFSLARVNFVVELPSSLAKQRIPVAKIRFTYLRSSQELSISPLLFPDWSYRENAECDLHLSWPPDLLICQNLNGIGHRHTDLCYFSLRVCASLALVRSLFSSFSATSSGGDHKWLPGNFSLHEEELIKYLGPIPTNALREAATKFLQNTNHLDGWKSAERLGPEPFPEVMPLLVPLRFSHALDALRSSYSDAVRERGTSVGVHSLISYKELFAKVGTAPDIEEFLDESFDRGELVSDTLRSISPTSVIHVSRACRTGEPRPVEWDRTTYLIPLAIRIGARIIGKVSKEPYQIPPLTLMKLLANFCMDYPRKEFPTLHCFVRYPFTHGPLIGVLHRQRAPRRTSIYDASDLGNRYAHDHTSGVFRAEPTAFDGILEAFPESGEPGGFSYDGLVNYFSALARFSVECGSVDALTALSICRSKELFHEQLDNNLGTWSKHLWAFLTSPDKQGAIAHLRAAELEAIEAAKKVDLLAGYPQVLQALKESSQRNIELQGPFGIIVKNAEPFPSSPSIEDLRALVRTCRIAPALAQAFWGKDTQKQDAMRIVQAHSDFIRAKPYSMSSPRLPSEDELVSTLKLVEAWTAERRNLLLQFSPGHYEDTHALRSYQERARNVAVQIVNKLKLERPAILYIDFSGYRSLGEPKEHDIGTFYMTAQKHCLDKSGHLLHGGQGGDDSMAFLFSDIRSAMDAVAVTRDGINNQPWTSSRPRIKYGISSTVLLSSEASRQTKVVTTYGLAKDACEVKTSSYRNSEDLVLSRDALEDLVSRGVTEEVMSHLKQIHGTSFYRYMF